MDGLFKRLAQQVLLALGRRDVAIGAEHDVVGGQAVGGDEEAGRLRFDDQASSSVRPPALVGRPTA